MNAVEASRSIATLLAQRVGKTVCPSEVARELAGPDGDWRAAMPSVHAAVDRLVDSGEIGITWRGQSLSGRDGPYRIGARR